jgi:hypothetical protein
LEFRVFFANNLSFFPLSTAKLGTNVLLGAAAELVAAVLEEGVVDGTVGTGFVA